MKKILLFTILFVFMTGCVSCVKKPEPIVDDKSKKWLEPKACYQHRWCLYYNTVTKKHALDCSIIYKACRNDEVFDFCKFTENLPDEMRFQECWDKKQ